MARSIQQAHSGRFGGRIFGTRNSFQAAHTKAGEHSPERERETVSIESESLFRVSLFVLSPLERSGSGALRKRALVSGQH